MNHGCCAVAAASAMAKCNTLHHQKYPGMQGLTRSNSRQHSSALSDDVFGGSIPAGRKASQASGMGRAASHSTGSNTPLVLNGVLSLATAGTWLQMLRSKLSNSQDRRRSDFADGPDSGLSTRDSTVSPTCMLPQQQEEDAYYPLPIRRSRSDALHDRQLTSVICRRGAELTRASSAGVLSELCCGDRFLTGASWQSCCCSNCQFRQKHVCIEVLTAWR